MTSLMIAGVFLDARTVERFLRYVDRRTPDECWEWQRGRFASGYGRLDVKRAYGRAWAPVCAHRIAWTLSHGAIPPGRFVCHHCDNPPCCNPDHLFLGRPRDNHADMIQKGRGRGPVGERNANHKLTDAGVVTLRLRGAAGESAAVLASEYGITDAHARRLMRGVWRRGAGGPIRK